MYLLCNDSRTPTKVT